MSGNSVFKIRLHPTTILVIWAVAVVLAMNSPSKVAIGTAIGTSIVALILTPTQFVRLVRRSRWLLLSIALLLSFFTPGLPLVDGQGFPLPTHEGMWAALDQGGRLMLALAMLSLLLVLIAPRDLVAGLRFLALAFRVPRQTGDLLALRLTMTLQELEKARDDSQQTNGYDQLLQSLRFRKSDFAAELSETFELRDPIRVPNYPMSRIDKTICCAALAVGALIYVATLSASSIGGGA
jgi:energy-coupling factor transporter transmembrane protein EcfT